MKSSYFIFLKKLLIFTIVVGLAGYVVFFILPVQFYTPAYPFLVAFFFALTSIVHYILQKAVVRRPARFVNQFMLTTFLKLLFVLIVMVIYALVRPGDAIRFIITYFCLYILFTTFEVISILNYARSISESDKE